MATACWSSRFIKIKMVYEILLGSCFLSCFRDNPISFEELHELHEKPINHEAFLKYKAAKIQCRIPVTTNPLTNPLTTHSKKYQLLPSISLSHTFSKLKLTFCPLSPSSQRYTSNSFYHLFYPKSQQKTIPWQNANWSIRPLLLVVVPPTAIPVGIQITKLYQTITILPKPTIP